MNSREYSSREIDQTDDQKSQLDDLAFEHYRGLRVGSMIVAILMIAIVFFLSYLFLDRQNKDVVSYPRDKFMDSSFYSGAGLNPEYDNSIVIRENSDYKSALQSSLSLKAIGSLKSVKPEFDIPVFDGVNDPHLLAGASQHIENELDFSIDKNKPYVLVSKRLFEETSHFFKIDSSVQLNIGERNFQYFIEDYDFDITKSQLKSEIDSLDNRHLVVYSCTSNKNCEYMTASRNEGNNEEN